MHILKLPEVTYLELISFNVPSQALFNTASPLKAPYKDILHRGDESILRPSPTSTSQHVDRNSLANRYFGPHPHPTRYSSIHFTKVSDIKGHSIFLLIITFITIQRDFIHVIFPRFTHALTEMQTAPYMVLCFQRSEARFPLPAYFALYCQSGSRGVDGSGGIP